MRAQTLLIWASDETERFLVRVDLTLSLRDEIIRYVALVQECYQQNSDFWQASFWGYFQVYENPDMSVFGFDGDRMVVDTTPEMEKALREELRTDHCQLIVDRDGDVSFTFRVRHGGREMTTDCGDIIRLYKERAGAARLECSLFDVARGVIAAWIGSDEEDLENEFFRGQMETIAHLLFATKWPNASGWMFGELADSLGKQARPVIRRMCQRPEGSPLIALETWVEELAVAWTEHISAIDSDE
jgi:hypothetical protein